MRRGIVGRNMEGMWRLREGEECGRDVKIERRGIMGRNMEGCGD